MAYLDLPNAPQPLTPAQVIRLQSLIGEWCAENLPEMIERSSMSDSYFIRGELTGQMMAALRSRAKQEA